MSRTAIITMSSDQNPDWWRGESVSRTAIITMSNEQNPDWWGGEPLSRRAIIKVSNEQNPDWWGGKAVSKTTTLLSLVVKSVNFSYSMAVILFSVTINMRH